MKFMRIKEAFFLTLVLSILLFINGCSGGGGATAKNITAEEPAKQAQEVVKEIVKQEEQKKELMQEVAPAPELPHDLLFPPNLKQTKKVVHPPYEAKVCTLCHKNDNPKDGNDLMMDMPGLCYQCHDKNSKEGKKFIHGPVGAGACTICHDPHESENSTLLRYSNTNELCTSCHAAKADFLRTTDNIHPPVIDSCVNCHDPHTEDYKFQLRADGKKDLCLSCHVDKKELIETAKNKHGAINMGNDCQNCHDPHGTGKPRMMKGETVKDVCLMCHSQTQVRDEDGVVMIDMGKHLQENPDWHGPVKWGDCAMCHNPHGSDNLRMLKKPFPETFYGSFDEKNYICFECHNVDKIKLERTIGDTNFRNGNHNMHYIHVNKKKGRTCRACHDFHGTKDLPHHLIKKTKFGKISFPLRFIETPTGGSCAPACHARRYYDREKPIKNLK